MIMAHSSAFGFNRLRRSDNGCAWERALCYPLPGTDKFEARFGGKLMSDEREAEIAALRLIVGNLGSPHGACDR